MNHALKGFIAVVFSAGIMWFGWWKYQSFLTQGSRPTEGTQILNRMEKEGVPNFILEDLKGEKVELALFKDKVVIVSFWASWCEPCVEEFPSLIKLVKKMDGEVILLAVSADYTLDALKAFIKAFEANDPNIKVMWDRDQEIANLFGTEILPESYILSYGNKLVRKIAGVDKWDAPQAIEFFKEIVELKKTAAKSSHGG